MKRPTGLYICLALIVAVAGGCSGSAPGEDSRSTNPTESNANASLNKEDYPVFPDADAGADPAVPADQGGKGFSGEGWETNTEFDLVGDPRAVKGGVLRDRLGDFPATLRATGPEFNTAFNYLMLPLVYESLVSTHPTTLEYIPLLATHWQVSPDRMTYRFRINPNARFSDGTPVTSEDVVATYDFMMDKGLQAPSNILTFEKLERPVAESKYIVRVKAKELNWRNFLYFGGMSILPAHELKKINGEQYLKDFNYRMLPGSGPYMVREADIDKGKSITIRRRQDYWDPKSRANVGLFNFDELRHTVVRDDNLAFEMFKKGDLDYFYIGTARVWAQEMDFDSIQRGVIQKRKIFNDQPQGYQGFAMNMRREPFNDIRVRQAMNHLTNRAQMIEKIAFNEYLPLNSYYPGTVYENPNNPKPAYDPGKALQLLAEAGWKDRDAQGRLVKNGQPFDFEMVYASKGFEPYLTIFQEDLRKVGINMNLRFVTPETQFQMIQGRKFQMALAAWGALLFPNPETSWHSRLADQDSTNNITGFKNSRVDEIFATYDRMFEAEERAAAIREIDGLIAAEYPYILLWYGPYERIAYWNKFGAPQGYISRSGDHLGSGTGPGIPQMWWIDPDKLSRLEQAMRDPSIKLEVGPTEDRYWIEYGKKEQERRGGTAVSR